MRVVAYTESYGRKGSICERCKHFKILYPNGREGYLRGKMKKDNKSIEMNQQEMNELATMILEGELFDE